MYSFYHLRRLRNDTVIHRLFSLGANEAITENNVRSTKRRCARALSINDVTASEEEGVKDFAMTVLWPL